MAKYTMPPRQKMINLLYVLLIAMLAINISTDVLEGYKSLNKSYAGHVEDAENYNKALLERVNSELSEAKRDSAARIAGEVIRLQGILGSLKEDIARQADKDDYRKGQLKAQDDLNAVPVVFLSATRGKGSMLQKELEKFRRDAASLVSDSARREYVVSLLKVDDRSLGMSWEKETFSYLPAIGGVMMLNKLEEEVLLTAAEVYRSLLFDKDTESLTKGQKYVLINAGQRVVNDDGSFDLPLVSLTPASSASVLYRGINNPLEIFCAGIAEDKLDVSISDGKVFKQGGRWVAVPGASKSVTISVQHVKNGKKENLSSMQFQVKTIPAPVPYLNYKDASGKQCRYAGNVPIRKEDLNRALAIEAEISDGPAVSFHVSGFETVLIKGASGKVTTIHSSGNKITDAQRNQIEQIEKGDKFYVTSITAVSQYGEKKQIAPINVIIL